VGTPDEVYERPANLFVMNFLGSVNLFHGRVHDGEARLGPLAAPAPDLGGARDAPAVGYVRPHELDIARHRNGAPTVEAVVRHVAAVGPTVRVELERTDDGGPIAAELTRERFGELALKPGEQVHVTPRKLQVFLEDYSI
jgi:sulfate transport system ATP-binding protein